MPFKFKKNKIAFVILDMRMLDKNGDEIFQQLKKSKLKAKILLAHRYLKKFIILFKQ
jgi:response regulator RpfG family c-di-GMP phosphodiesterase